MNKKVIAAVLAAASLLSVTGCGAKKDGETAKEKVIWLIPADAQSDVASVNAEASRIMQEHGIDAELELQFIDSAAYSERMTMNMASGTEFDLCFTGYLNPYLSAVQKGGYYELDELLENSPLKDEIGEFNLENAGMVDGHVYGIPNMQVMAGQTGIFVLKDLAEEYGLKTDEITCLEDLEPFMEWVKTNHPEKYVFRNTNYGGGWKEYEHTDIISKCVRIVSKDDGSYEAMAITDWPYYYEEGDKCTEYFNKGYIRQDITTVMDDSLEKSTGKYAIWRSAYKPGAQEENNLNYPDSEAICIPVGYAFVSAGEGRNAMTAINAKSKHPELAFKVMELANTDKEFFNVICNGIKDKHYTLNSDGTLEYTDNSGYKLGAAWKFGSVFNSYPVKGQSTDIWEETKEFNSNAKKSNLIGFTFDTTPVRTQIAQIEAVLGKYTFDPAKNEENKPIIVKELTEAGMYEVLDEVNKQLDEWEASRK